MCGRQFVGGNRIENGVLWREYTEGKQTYEQLGQRYGCSVRTIQRRLDRVEVKAAGEGKESKLGKVVIETDTTYFGRNFGVLLIYDVYRGRMLHREFVKYETNDLYAKCVNGLKEQGYEIAAIVCDGRKGLFQLFGNTPIQMCQFHQTAIITRYLTRKPKTLASQELRSLALTLSKTDKQTFSDGLARWFERWQKFLNERSVNPITGKTFFTHRRLRSASRSLTTNLPWLFTYEDFPDLRIPNTTNLLEGIFADLKNKLRCHNGLSKQRRMKFIDEFFKA